MADTAGRVAGGLRDESASDRVQLDLPQDTFAVFDVDRDHVSAWAFLVFAERCVLVP
ncbi:hypothetical protein [Streptomyces sp. NBC_01361]|uniref:hypothetical protein n=1 Tax=Streptomyces sp. NBC_01361 TaxID=2903838 RepID=UPI002E31B3EF|nr:hypothetical protein [Streptomyces sp. NBC_01361]